MKWKQPPSGFARRLAFLCNQKVFTQSIFKENEKSGKILLTQLVFRAIFRIALLCGTMHKLPGEISENLRNNTVLCGYTPKNKCEE